VQVCPLIQPPALRSGPGRTDLHPGPRPESGLPPGPGCAKHLATSEPSWSPTLETTASSWPRPGGSVAGCALDCRRSRIRNRPVSPDRQPDHRRRTSPGRARLRAPEDLARPHQAPDQPRPRHEPPARPARADEPRNRPMTDDLDPRPARTTSASNHEPCHTSHLTSHFRMERRSAREETR
jgi:hypothetical protein